jgi:hypothetical protein
MIIPTLPNEGIAQGRAHQRQYNQPVFTWAISQGEPDECPNCGGNGEVYMRLAEKGPFSYVPQSKKAITWYDGDGTFPKGWYIIRETIGFVCPKCKGAQTVRSEPVRVPMEAK